MEQEDLKRAQTELDEINSLAKARAEADADLRLFQKMQAEYQPVEPLEVKPVRDRGKAIADELKGLAQDVSEYHSEYRENRRADVSNAEKEKKHRLRENLLIAAFTVALTLFFEHIQDIIELVLKLFRSLS